MILHRDFPIQKICIIGLGLIGGSIAKALKLKAGFHDIIGVDVDEEQLLMAKSSGIIDYGTSCIPDGVNGADLIFICTPVSHIVNTLEQIIPFLKDGAIVTDVGSTKKQIVNNAASIIPPRISFIGGHPMAGTEKSGYSSSNSHLFENAYYLLTPGINTKDIDLSVLKEIVVEIGSIPVVLSPEYHDNIVGIISHVPHIIAAALINLAQSDNEKADTLQRLAAGGFKDITRIASSNPLMWKDICISNQIEIHKLLLDFQNILNSFDAWLCCNDTEKVYHYFAQARSFRDQITDKPISYVFPYYDIYIDVEDKPGIIGEVATLLGNKGINIKNIGIINSREEDPGALRISLPDEESQSSALQILISNEYKANKK